MMETIQDLISDLQSLSLETGISYDNEIYSLLDAAGICGIEREEIVAAAWSRAFALHNGGYGEGEW